MGDYLKGKILAEAIGEGKDYVMSFEKEPKESNKNKNKSFEFSEKW
jgi:hypothetical protein